MTTGDRLLTLDEAAAACELDVLVVRFYEDLRVIVAREGYGSAELAQLRRVRRLMHDLELEPQAIAIILRMRQRILALQAELGRLEADLRAPHTHRWRAVDWIEAEWHDL